MASAEDRALQAELSEARFAILRQLEILRPVPMAHSASRSPPDSRAIIAQLERQLAEIDEALADLADQG